MKRSGLTPAALALLSALAGCADIRHVQHSDATQSPVVIGPRVTPNFTPLHTSIACFNEALTASRKLRVRRYAVGNIKDYTGKISEDSGGAAVTQGASLMMISALGKLGKKVRLIERFDTRVADIEFNYLQKKFLGDGIIRRIPTPDGDKTVRWIPYKGGSVRAADYFIVGGVTELNYNIQSGGAEVRINNIGPRARTYVVNVAADLRIVKTATLELVKTISLQKQIVGYEVSAQVFEFFGHTLLDFNAGAKNQEPLQLGVRAIMELGALKLTSAVTGVSSEACIDEADWQPKPGEPVREALPQHFEPGGETRQASRIDRASAVSNRGNSRTIK